MVRLSRKGKGELESESAPIGIPADPEPHDPLVGKDRPKEVKDEKEIGDRPRDEAVEFGRATARVGWGRWGERSQGGRGRCGLFFAPPTRLVSDHHDGDFSVLIPLWSTVARHSRGILRTMGGPGC